ncbi:hypothetical protein T265_02182 [Opisthorchis viverrini]|uniref:UspA domain-containing protein n=1 Tax=Opisthorchis viverrini TaxID=6198 RepID=A0A075AII2_OPIVI|nr:hypothetical protein T265_02182 [Opisthorchis viverrini]KER31679.1 hypothetical protein T265_02182 [Opisthorchis viverrini]
MPIELAPEAVEAPRRIILPIDNSEHSKRAIDWYFANVQRENDFLLFVHVVEPTRNNSSVGVAIESAPSLLGTVLRVSEESVKEGKQICREAMQKASAHDVKGQSFLYVDTKPAAAILRAISELKGDLVIIGSRGIGSSIPSDGQRFELTVAGERNAVVENQVVSGRVQFFDSQTGPTSIPSDGQRFELTVAGERNAVVENQVVSGRVQFFDSQTGPTRKLATYGDCGVVSPESVDTIHPIDAVATGRMSNVVVVTPVCVLHLDALNQSKVVERK